MQLSLTCAQQLKLGPGSHEPFNGVEHLLKVCVVRCYHGRPNKCSSVLVLQPCFGSRNLEAPLQLGHEGANQGALLFEAMDITQEDVEFNPTNPHGSLLSPHLEPILSKRSIEVEEAPGH